MTPGSNAALEVLKFTEKDFSFHWIKVGSRCQIQTNVHPPNVLTFNEVSKKDFGYYRCDVKEAGRVVLTVFRALYEKPCTSFNPKNVTSPSLCK